MFVYFAGEHVYCKQVKKSPLGRIKLSFSYTFVFGKRSVLSYVRISLLAPIGCCLVVGNNRGKLAKILAFKRPLAATASAYWIITAGVKNCCNVYCYIFEINHLVSKTFKISFLLDTEES